MERVDSKSVTGGRAKLSTRLIRRRGCWREEIRVETGRNLTAGWQLDRSSMWHLVIRVSQMCDLADCITPALPHVWLLCQAPSRHAVCGYADWHVTDPFGKPSQNLAGKRAGGKKTKSFGKQSALGTERQGCQGQKHLTMTRRRGFSSKWQLF